MKILFVMSHVRRSLYSVPLGAASIAAQLIKARPELSCSIINDYPEEMSLTAFAKRLFEAKAEVICFTLTVWNRPRIESVIEQLKQLGCSSRFMVGGPELSAALENIQSEGLFDCLIPGEGEGAISAILGFLEEDSCPRSVSAEVLPTHEVELSTLTSPWLTGLLKPSDYEGLLWELARGCPFHCSFCYESKGSSHVRHFPMERIAAELKLFKEAGVRNLFVLDPTFNYNLSRSKELLQLFLKEGEGIHFCFEARAEFVDEELAQMMAELDCSLQIGLQSAEIEVLKKINRAFNKEKFLEHLQILDQAGVIYGLDLIYGLPGDSIEGFLRSLRFSFQVRPNHLDIFRLSILPSTKLGDEAAQLGLIWQHEAPYEVQSSETFSAEDLNYAEKIAYAVDFYYNKGAAVVWYSFLAPLLEKLSLGLEAPFVWAADKNFSEKKVEEMNSELVEAQVKLFTEFFKHKLTLANLSHFENFLLLLADFIRWFGSVALLDFVEPDEEGLFRAPSIRLNYLPDNWLPLIDEGMDDLFEMACLLEEMGIYPIADGIKGQVVADEEGVSFLMEEWS